MNGWCLLWNVVDCSISLDLFDYWVWVVGQVDVVCRDLGGDCVVGFFGLVWDCFGVGGDCCC